MFQFLLHFVYKLSSSIIFSACTELVEKASQEQSSGALEGESLLLPLLQGLLQAPENEPPSDSGVESGEDQRSNLIAEVQVALQKLAVSLRSDATDITTERRSSLLQLVTKLQDGLATTNPKIERRLSSGPGRFTKKRDRQNRHTVGVSSEELANARRLIEEISISDLTRSQSKNELKNLQKQNSEGSVITSNNSSFNKFSGRTTVKNATAKPFSSSSNSISNASSTIQTPTDTIDHLDSPFGDDLSNQDPAPIALVKTHSNSSNNSEEINTSLDTTHLGQSISDVENIKSIHQAVQAAARKKVNSESMESEIEEDSSTVKSHEEQEIIEVNPTSLQENPIYNKINENTEPPKLSYEEKVSRFNTQTKKLKMKRANTIDIPKSLQYYEDDDSESESETEAQKRRNTYYALRGPIRVGNPVNRNTVPAFELKTKSDKKFLDFLSKNNADDDHQGSIWAQQNKTSVWTNKFGNIKNNFENKSGRNDSARNFWKSQDDAANSMSGVTNYGPKISRRSARNLQQMFEERQKLSEERILPTNKHIVSGHLTVKTEPERNYKCISQPVPVNKFSHAPQSAFKPIPKKIQVPQETYTAQSFKPNVTQSFQPIAQKTQPAILPQEPKKCLIKTEIKEKKDDKPLFLYSPKPLLDSPTNSTSPVSSKPWLANRIDQSSRVLNIAAKKFELPKQAETYPVKPRKLHNDYNKIFNSQPSTPEKITAPYLSKGTEQRSNTVRKMSAEFETLGNKAPEYACHSTVKYQTNSGLSSAPQTARSDLNQRSYDSGSSYRPSNVIMENSSRKFEQPLHHTQVYNKIPPENTQNTDHIYLQNVSHSPFQNYGQNQNHNTRTQLYSSNHLNYNRTDSYDSQIRSPIKSTFNSTSEFQPVNYSIRYDQPGVQHNDRIESTVTSAPQLFQHVPGKDDDQIPPDGFTSTSSIQFNIKTNNKHQILPTVESIAHPPKLETQLSSESVHEYNAINSKVMTGPVSQQAITVRQKSPMNRNEHDMEAAFNLKNSLQRVTKGSDDPSIKSPNNSFKYKSQVTSPNTSFKYKSAEPQIAVGNKITSEVQEKFMKTSRKDYPIPKEKTVPITQIKKHKFPEPFSSRSFGGQDTKTFGVVKPMQQKPTVPISSTPNAIYNTTSIVRKPQSHESFELNEKGQSVITSKFHIPVINVAPSTPAAKPTHAQILSKCDSWNQICQATQASNKPASPTDTPQNRGIVKSKSSHSLAVPSRQFEAGMSKKELMQKKRCIEAYFAVGKSPQNEELPKTETKVVKRSINRLKTSEKLSASRQTTGLSRSRTLPDIVCPELLDENNVDKSFEALFKSAS